MKSREIFRKWALGCLHTNTSNTGARPLPPWRCNACTAEMFDAIGEAFIEEDREEYEAADPEKPAPAFKPAPSDLLQALRAKHATLPGSETIRLRDAQISLENQETANHALRVELHMAQQLLAGANGSIALLARGAGAAKSAHLLEAANLTAIVADQQTELDDVQRELRELKERINP